MGKYLGLSRLSGKEIEFIFNTMNKSKSGMMRKDEFTYSVKKDIPVSIGKVVNVKEILYDTFERILKEYDGIKTAFPRRESKSIVHRVSDQKQKVPPSRTKKKSIFQRILKRKKTIKAPVKSPFGSNLAEMAETQSTMMDDIILSMMNEDDVSIRNRTDSAMITSEEFRQLFSHSFFPKTKEEKQEETKSVKSVNINELSMVHTTPKKKIWGSSESCTTSTT